MTLITKITQLWNVTKISNPGIKFPEIGRNKGNFPLIFDIKIRIQRERFLTRWKPISALTLTFTWRNFIERCQWDLLIYASKRNLVVTSSSEEVLLIWYIIVISAVKNRLFTDIEIATKVYFSYFHSIMSNSIMPCGRSLVFVLQKRAIQAIYN